MTRFIWLRIQTQEIRNFPLVLGFPALVSAKHMEQQMRKFLIASASFAALSLMPGVSFAQDVVVEPDVETWAMGQPDTSVVVDQDVVVGDVLPDTVQVIEVPKYKKYRFVVVNKKRVIIDAGTRKIIKIY